MKINNNQKLNWPWFSDFEFELNTKVYKWDFIFDKQVNYSKKFNFINLSNDIMKIFSNECDYKIIYDYDASLIIDNNCE